MIRLKIRCKLEILSLKKNEWTLKVHCTGVFEIKVQIKLR